MNVRGLVLAVATLSLLGTLTMALPGTATEMSSPADRAGSAVQVQGASIVNRPAPEATLPLRPHDPVFVRDRVTTAEKSLVRLLLGGKALVTVRELSHVTIVDTPGRSAITLTEGKLALGLARSLVRPGEQVDVRTPNAVAGIRGSFLVAETHSVNGVVETVFSSLEVHKPIIVTLADGSSQVLLGINQTVRISGRGPGAAVSPVRDLRPDEIAEVAAAAAGPSLMDRYVGPPPETLQLSAGLPVPSTWTYAAPPSSRTFSSSPDAATPSAGTSMANPPTTPPAVPPVVVAPPPATPPPTAPPVVVTPPPVIPPPPVVLAPARGLERANEVAGPHGQQGRTNAASHQR